MGNRWFSSSSSPGTTLPDALACLATLEKVTYSNHHVLVVDNGSTDGTPQAIQQRYPERQSLCHDHNLGYAEGNNTGLRLALAAGADYVLLLNDDTLVEPESLSTLVAAAEGRSLVGHARAGARLLP